MRTFVPIGDAFPRDLADAVKAGTQVGRTARSAHMRPRSLPPGVLRDTIYDGASDPCRLYDSPPGRHREPPHGRGALLRAPGRSARPPGSPVRLRDRLLPLQLDYNWYPAPEILVVTSGGMEGVQTAERSAASPATSSSSIPMTATPLSPRSRTRPYCCCTSTPATWPASRGTTLSPASAAFPPGAPATSPASRVCACSWHG